VSQTPNDFSEFQVGRYFDQIIPAQSGSLLVFYYLKPGADTEKAMAALLWQLQSGDGRARPPTEGKDNCEVRLRDLYALVLADMAKRECRLGTHDAWAERDKQIDALVNACERQAE